MRYVNIPREISLSELRAEDYCFSPGRYVRFNPPKMHNGSRFVPLDKLVVVREENVRAIKSETYRYAEIGDINVANGGIVFHPLRGWQLPTKRPARAKIGDVLISTVRTYRKGIGLVTDDGQDLVTTNAVLNLCGVTDYIPYVTLPYVYAFLRSDFFVEQVWSLLHRGVYPRMDTGALDKIVLPVPDDKDVITYVGGLALAIADKEKEIRRRNAAIDAEIERELLTNSHGRAFQYQLPTSHEVRNSLRLDAGIYAPKFRREEHLVKSYKRGWQSYREFGFSISRGQNLQISAIGKSIYSDIPKPDFYRLVAPTDISEYRTVEAFRYLGNKRELDLVKRGDVIFGAEGFCKGRCVILVDEQHRTISNIHGLIFHPLDGSMTRGIFLGCFLGYLRRVGIVDAIGAGGSGGSLAIGYLNQVPFPKFPEEIQKRIAALYHSDGAPPRQKLTVSNFVTWHRDWNRALGIWELDRELKSLQLKLATAQDHVLEGRPVDMPV